MFWFFGQQHMWDLTSLTRDQTYTLCTGKGKVLTPEAPGKLLHFKFYSFFILI